MPDHPRMLTQGHPRPSADQARLRRSRTGLLAVTGLVVALVLAVTGALVVGASGRCTPRRLLGAAPPQNRYGAPIPTTPRDVRPLEVNVYGALDHLQSKALNTEPAGQPGIAITDWKGVDDPRWVRILGAPDLAETPEHVSILATTTNDDLVGVYHSHMFDITQATTVGGLRPWWDSTR